MNTYMGEDRPKTEFPNFSDLTGVAQVESHHEPEVVEAGVLNGAFISKTIETIVTDPTTIDPSKREEICSGIQTILTGYEEMIINYRLQPQNALHFLSGFVPVESGLTPGLTDLTNPDQLLTLAKYLDSI